MLVAWSFHHSQSQKFTGVLNEVLTLAIYKQLDLVGGGHSRGCITSACMSILELSPWNRGGILLVSSKAILCTL